MKFFGVIALGFALLSSAGAAMAAAASDAAPVVGIWEDKLPSGSIMFVTLTDKAITFQMADARGNGAGPPTTIPVSFAKSPDGAVKLTPTGPIGEPMAVRLNSPDVLVLEFQGLPPRTMKRQKIDPAAAAKPHGG